MKAIRLTAEEYARATGQPMPVKDAVRVKAGRQAQKGGQRFEDELDAAHARLRVNGVADISALPVPTRQGPGGKLFRVKRQKCDYFGWLFGSGRAVVMEAKSFEHTSMQIRAGDATGKGIKAHQIRALRDAQAAGAFAAIVWRNGTRLLRFTDFVRFNPGAKSIPVSMFDEIEKLEDWIAPATKGPP